ncbi:MAG: hypothetical protein ACI4EF_07060 [Coprococcus sp.]
MWSFSIDKEAKCYLSYASYASFAKVYSKESNEGYSKSIVNDGDFVFTIFVRNSDHDDFHPDYLCYVDYTGEVKDELSFYNGAMYIDNENGEETGGTSSGGGYIENRLYIGNLNDGESLKITAGVLDYDSEQAFLEAKYEAYESDKGEFPSYIDYAISYGSTVITIK